jgi:hypothetical protein
MTSGRDESRTRTVRSVLVFPAASKPSINRRISFDPKTLFIIFDIDPPILLVGRYAHSIAVLRYSRRSFPRKGGEDCVVVMLIALDSDTRGS